MVAYMVAGFIIAFDMIAGTCIPLSYGRGCGWFFVPNLCVNAVAIYEFVKFIRKYR